MSHIIEIKNLKKTFPVFRNYGEVLKKPFERRTVSVLDGINLSVKKGELFGVLGQNGAGKTTLLKILATLILPDAGDITVNGYDVIKEPDKVRTSVGYVISEERSFYWRLTGRQNLKFFASLQKMCGIGLKNKVDEVLELVGLSNSADRIFMNYSTGMKQRLSIARGLLTNPEIFLVDEGTRGLDPVVAIAIKEFIFEKLIKQMKKTVIWVTNNAYEAEEFCSRVAIIHNKQIAHIGTPKEIRQNLNVTSSFDGVFSQIIGDKSDV